jgi:quinol monooxygenase YgiN
MPGAFVYVGTMTIQPGKQEEAHKRLAELIDFVETNEPRMIAFHVYLDEQEGKLTIVQLHPDSASMELHMQVNAKHFTTAFGFLESVVSEQYYGAISQTLATELAKWDDPAIVVTRMPTYEGGFTRTNVR